MHGPLPVATREGYRYWITFLDDATSYRAAMRLKRKSQALEAFKLFKATAENQLDAKIKELQDDKGWCDLHILLLRSAVACCESPRVYEFRRNQ